MSSYTCPYCKHEKEESWDDWEGVDFEGNTDIECPACGKKYYAHRSWVAYYDSEKAETYEARQAEDKRHYEEARKAFSTRSAEWEVER